MDLTTFRNLIAESDRLRASGLIVLEGRHLFDRLLDGGGQPEAVLCVPALQQEMLGLSGGRWPVSVLPEPEIGSLVGFPFHRGLIALARRPEVHPFDPAALPSAGGVLVLPRVTDEANLGAILRSAAAFGVRLVLLGPGCADPFSRKALRAGMGASLRLTLRAAEPSALAQVRALGYDVVAAHRSSDAVPLEALAPRPRWAVVFGHETEGVPPEWLRECACSVWIPMAGGMDSLNVAVSAGIVLWELLGKGRAVQSDQKPSIL